jgi:hypothetical protein
MYQARRGNGSASCSWERDCEVLAEQKIRCQPRLPALEDCLRFIADSSDSSTLIGLCRTKGPLFGLPLKMRWDKMVGNTDPDSRRPFIEVNVGTTQHRCYWEGKNCHV